MQEIDKKDLLGHWEEKATQRNSEMRSSKETASIWIFTSDGKAVYKYIDLKKLITHMDDRFRTWDIVKEDMNTYIIINDERSYKVISVEPQKLVLFNVRNGLLYHFEKQW